MLRAVARSSLQSGPTRLGMSCIRCQCRLHTACTDWSGRQGPRRRNLCPSAGGGADAARRYDPQPNHCSQRHRLPPPDPFAACADGSLWLAWRPMHDAIVVCSSRDPACQLPVPPDLSFSSSSGYEPLLPDSFSVLKRIQQGPTTTDLTLMGSFCNVATQPLVIEAYAIRLRIKSDQACKSSRKKSAASLEQHGLVPHVMYSVQAPMV